MELQIKRNSFWLAGAIFICIFIAYLPAIRGQFIWLDDLDLTHNPLITAPDGLGRIWTPGETYQYYPLSFTTFWMLHKLWGFNPIGYHVVNILFHSIVVLLFWYLLHYLKIPGALGAALIFALHPIEVESVAWIAELKNTQSVIFFLAALISYLRFEDDNENKWYWLALILFLLALLSKTSTIMLPVTLLLLRWWRQRSWNWKAVLRVLPFFMLSALSAIVCIYQEKYQAGATGEEWASGLAEKISLSGRIIWFYLGKLIVPSRLVYFYPRWSIDPNLPISYLPIFGWLTVMVILWRKRQSWGRTALMGMGFFTINLFPVLGFLNIYYMRFSYVADRWQYLPGLGVIALVAGGITEGWGRWSRIKGIRTVKYSRAIGICLAVVVLTVLGRMTWNQSRLFKDKESLLRNTLKVNTRDWMIYARMANVLSQKRRSQEAISYYSQALKLNPADVGTLNDLGNALLGQGNIKGAITYYLEALRVNPDSAPAHNNMGVARARQGKLDQAIAHYSEALRINPDYTTARNNLEIARFKVADPEEALVKYKEGTKPETGFYSEYGNRGINLSREGKYNLAEAAFHSALELNPNDYPSRTNLGNLYNIQGRYPEAVREYEISLAIKESFKAHYNFGFLLFNKLQKPGKALSHLKKALDMTADPLHKTRLQSAISQIRKNVE